MYLFVFTIKLLTFSFLKQTFVGTKAVITYQTVLVGQFIRADNTFVFWQDFLFIVISIIFFQKRERRDFLHEHRETLMGN